MKTREKPGLHAQIHRTVKLCRLMLVQRVCSRAAAVPQLHWGKKSGAGKAKFWMYQGFT